MYRLHAPVERIWVNARDASTSKTLLAKQAMSRRYKQVFVNLPEVPWLMTVMLASYTSGSRSLEYLVCVRVLNTFMCFVYV